MGAEKCQSLSGSRFTATRVPTGLTSTWGKYPTGHKPKFSKFIREILRTLNLFLGVIDGLTTGGPLPLNRADTGRYRLRPNRFHRRMGTHSRHSTNDYVFHTGHFSGELYIINIMRMPRLDVSYVRASLGRPTPHPPIQYSTTVA